MSAVHRLHLDDLQMVVRRMPKDVRAALREHRGKLFVAGGFIRAVIADEEISDVDFFGDDRALRRAASTLEISRRDSRKLETKNAITIAAPDCLPLQFITRWRYDSPEDCAADFDFTVCQAVVYADAGGKFTSVIGEAFYRDLAAKRLVYRAPKRDEEAGGSMLRAIKYAKRGYRIPAFSLGALIARVVEKYDPVSRISMADFAVARMQEVDPLLIIDGMPTDTEERIEGLPLAKVPLPVAQETDGLESLDPTQ